jgi:hypothetical protein
MISAASINAYRAGLGLRPLHVTHCEGCGLERETPVQEPLEDATADLPSPETHPASTCHVCARKALLAVQTELDAAAAALKAAVQDERTSRLRAEKTLLDAEAERQKWRTAEALTVKATKALAEVSREREELASIRKPIGEFRDKLQAEEAASMKRIRDAETGLKARQKAVDEAEAKPKVAARLIEDLRIEYVAVRRQTKAAKTRLQGVLLGRAVLEPE